MKASTLSQLKNIGKTVETRLNEIGVYTKANLKQLGSVKAYQRLSQKQPGKHLPVYYYLYSRLVDAVCDVTSSTKTSTSRQCANTSGMAMTLNPA